MTKPNRKESRISRAFHWTERHEFLSFLIFAAVAFTLVLGGGKLFMAHTAHVASEHAKSYVGRHTFANAKWFMFQDRVELLEEGQKEGEGLSVPVNTDFGSQVSGEFIEAWVDGPYHKPKLQVPLTVDITYTPEPQNKWPDTMATKDYQEGAYLRFQIVRQGPDGNDVAEAPSRHAAAAEAGQ